MCLGSRRIVSPISNIEFFSPRNTTLLTTQEYQRTYTIHPKQSHRCCISYISHLRVDGISPDNIFLLNMTLTQTLALSCLKLQYMATCFCRYRQLLFLQANTTHSLAYQGHCLMEQTDRKAQNRPDNFVFCSFYTTFAPWNWKKELISILCQLSHSNMVFLFVSGSKIHVTDVYGCRVIIYGLQLV